MNAFDVKTATPTAKMHAAQTDAGSRRRARLQIRQLQQLEQLQQKAGTACRRIGEADKREMTVLFLKTPGTEFEPEKFLIYLHKAPCKKNANFPVSCQVPDLPIGLPRRTSREHARHAAPTPGNLPPFTLRQNFDCSWLVMARKSALRK